MTIRTTNWNRRLGAGLLLLGVGISSPAWALNILVSNDDGFETANIRALYQRLKAAGHDVVVAAPTQNNSGKGGSMNFLVPVTPLAKATRYSTVAAGATGVGADPNDANVFYVDGTPVMSMLYGLDVVAQQHWGKQPDLVISGPNEGANLGAINNSSGTFNNALYAINRGIPAIAVSYGNPGSRSYTALASGAIEYELADIVVNLVSQLDAQKADGRLLPAGVGLNVNVPVFTAGNGAALPFRFSRLGTATDYQPVFFGKLSDSALANQVLPPAYLNYPGISLVSRQQTPPSGVVIPADTNPLSEANVSEPLAAGSTAAIAVSVVEGVPQARRSNEDWVRVHLQSLLGGAQ